MPSCAAIGCNHKPSKKIPGITFHRFPKKSQLRDAWIKACRRENWVPSSSAVLCNEHFSADMFNRTLSRVRLHDDAIPHIFKSFPSYLQKVPNKRKSPIKRCAPALSSSKCIQDDIFTPNDESEQSTSPEIDPMPSQDRTSILPINTVQVISTVPERKYASTSLMVDPKELNVKQELEESTSHEIDPIPYQDSSSNIPISMVQVIINVPDKKDASTSPMKDTDEHNLKRKLEKSALLLAKYKKKIKQLQQQNRRVKQRLSDLNSLFQSLKDKHFMEEDYLDVLQRTSPNIEILKRQALKEKKEKTMSKQYSKALQTFASTLHLYSPRAYEYVRETFDTCLPHSRTICKWLQKVDAAPGFTTESLKALSDDQV